MASDPPIVITSDTDLASQASANEWPGDGSSGNPYVISGLVINGTEKNNAIWITDTADHLVIRDNVLHNVTRYTLLRVVAGILLENANNITVSSNEFRDIPDGSGVSIQYSQANAVDNVFTTVHLGVLFSHSRGDFLDNRVQADTNGIVYQYASQSPRVAGNTFTHTSSNDWSCGVDLYQSSYVTVENNRFEGLSRAIRSQDRPVTIRNNTVVACLEGIDLSDSTNVVCVNNDIEARTYGIWYPTGRPCGSGVTTSPAVGSSSTGTTWTIRYPPWTSTRAIR